MQTFLVALGLFILWRLKIIVLIIFLAFLVTTVFYPVVAWLKKHRWPTPFAILVPILFIIGLLALIFYLLLPPFLTRVADFAENLPNLINHAAGSLHLSANANSLTDSVKSRLGGLSHIVFTVTFRVLEILGGVLTILIMSIYWLVSYETVQKEILSYFHGSGRRRLKDIWRRIELKLHQWIKAHLILNTVVALLVWIGMSALGIQFAELLAFIAFLVEIIPTAGPIIAAIPAIILGVSHSLIKGVVVALVYLVIQQIESHLLSPLLLGKTVRLHPIVIIISLLLGYEIYSIIGAFIAVPVALCVSAVTDSYRKRPQPPTNPVLQNAYLRAKRVLRLG